MAVDAYCKGCIYLGTNSMGKCCDYNYVTGKARRCPAGDGCTKRLIGSKKRYVPSLFAASEKAKPDPPEPKKKGRPRRELPPDVKPYDRERVRRRMAREEHKKMANGRQRASIMAYKDANNATYKDIAAQLGVNESTIQKWCCEYVPANWELLAKIGIQRPEGL
jgi:hypothetical protein